MTASESPPRFDAFYRLLDYRFRVQSDVLGWGRVVDAFLSGFADVPGEGGPTYVLSRLPDRIPYVLRVGDADIVRIRTQRGAADHLLWHTSSQAIERCSGHLVLHAAAASWSGRGVVLPAPSGSGKTTLVAGLTRAGFGYLSDEAVPIDPVDARMHPFPRPLWIHSGSIDAMPGLRETLLPTFRRAATDQIHIRPDDLRPGAVAGSCPVRYVITPNYERGSTTELIPMTRAEAVITLAHSSFNFRAYGGRGLNLLGQVVSGAECYRLRVGDLDSAVKAVASLMG